MNDNTKKERKHMKLWEKILVLISISVIIGFIIIYSSRFIYHYKLEHPKVDKSDKRLITAILKNNKTVIKGDGLYQEKDNEQKYYFYGKNINNNYIYYSGRLWRIINIDNKTVSLITEDIQSSIVWGTNNDYEKSYISGWLKDNFLKTLNDYENYIVESSFCIDTIELDSITCEDKYKTNVGLITVEEYLKAGGNESYLNTGKYFWTMNSSVDNKIWYIFDEGGINNDSNTVTTYYSYGVRPVIRIKKDVTSYSGNGTKNNPYYLDDNTNTVLSSKQVGNYVMFSDYKWRIQNKNDDYVKLILDNYYAVNDENYKIKYDDSSPMYSNTSTVGKYLSNKFYKNLNSSHLKKCTFYVGSYGENSKYDYKNIYKNKINAYVGLSSIGEMFINDYDNTWLSNNIDEYKLIAYIAKNAGTYFADSIENNNYIRPVICVDNNLATTSGNGTINNPFILEVENETNN